MATIIDGKKVSEDLREDLKVQTEKFVEETGIQPHLVVVIVGNNPASMTYVRNKKRSCEAVGFKSTVIELADTITEADLLAQIDVLNQDDSVHGILVQLPLPKHINEDHIISAIDVKKDVDGFHPYQVGCLASGLDSLKPCTPAGVIGLL